MSFVIGLVIGGFIGMMIMGIINAGTPDDDEIERWQEMERMLDGNDTED